MSWRRTTRATPDHPFYVPSHGAYVDLRDLELGTTLHVSGGGEALLVSKTWLQGDFEVFNFEVEAQHNYFVRASESEQGGLLVHNGKYGRGGGGSCLVAGTEISTAAFGLAIEDVVEGDRVVSSQRGPGDWRVAASVCLHGGDEHHECVAAAASTDGDGKMSPMAENGLMTRAGTWARRAVAAGCVAGACQAMAYDATTGLWEDSAFSIAVHAEELLGPDGHLYRVTDDGLLDRGVVDDFEALVAADVAVDEAWEDGAPDWDDWVLVLGDDEEAGHQRLLDVRAGDRFAWQGRVFDTRSGGHGVGSDGAWELRDSGQVLARVTETFKRMAVDEVIDLEVAYPNGSVDVLTGTEEHPFWVEAEQAWVPLGELAEGDVLTTDGGGEALVVGLTVKPGANEVFNIEVAGPHNYFVQADGSDGPGVLVHNKGFDRKSPCPMRIHPGKQGKHIRGHNNFDRKKSEIYVDANSLLGQVPLGYPGDKNIVDFGQFIGAVADATGQLCLTSRGKVHYSKTGLHIVPH